MRSTNKVVIVSKKMYDGSQDAVIKELIRRDTRLICVMGMDAEFIEDVIDEFAVGDGAGRLRNITTTSHTEESLQQVLASAESFDLGELSEISIIEM